MNILLPLLLSFVMLFSGTAAPEVPENMREYRLEKLEFHRDGESVAPDMQYLLTLATGAGEFFGAFEAHADGETFLPMALHLDEGGASFRLREDGAVYHADAALVEAFLADQLYPAFPILENLINSLLPSAAELIHAPCNPGVMNALLDALAERRGAEVQETELELEGETLPGRSFSAAMSDMDADGGLIYEIFDFLMEQGDAPMRAFSRSLLDYINEAEGMQYAAFSEMLSEAESEDSGMTLEIGFVGAGDHNCLFLRTPESEMRLIWDGEAREFVQVSGVSFDESALALSFSQEVRMRMDGGNFLLFMTSGIEVPALEEVFRSREENSFEIIDRDGLKDVRLRMRREDGAYSLSVEGDAIESAMEDGGVRADCALRIALDDDPQGELRFSILSRELPYENPLAGAETIAVSDNIEDDWYRQLDLDGMMLASDAALLSANEDVVALLSLANRESALEAEPWDDGQAVPQTVSMEILAIAPEHYSDELRSTASVYPHPIPDYKLPEGFVPESIFASHASVSSDFRVEGGLCTLVITPPEPEPENADVRILQGRRLHIRENGDGSIDLARLYLEDATLSFNFSDGSMELLELALSGLE